MRFSLARSTLLFCFLLTIPSPIKAESSSYRVLKHEYYEGKEIASFKLSIQNSRPTDNPSAETKQLLEQMSTHEGDRFSHELFDADLKRLSQKFERVIPIMKTNSCGDLDIVIELYKSPILSKVRIEGNRCVLTERVLEELDLEENAPFNRQAFFKSFNKLKEYYVKEGFFESKISYTITPNLDPSEVTVQIFIQEGRKGHIEKVVFTGVSDEERAELSDMILTRRYNLLSWLLGTGTYNQEEIDRDRQTIISYFHDKGYPDALVQFHIEDGKKGCILLEIEVVKGELYHFGTISFKGNNQISNEKIIDVLPIRPGKIYSAEKLRQSVQDIQRLYGDEGYIETRVSYQLGLHPLEPVYDVDFEIQESSQYKIGLIRVVGNVSTSSRLILQYAKIYPGDLIRSSLLSHCEQRLLGTGLFKEVKVYASHSSINPSLGPQYRDVIIEVEETPTGSMNFFFGLSTTDSIFGGLDLHENNFDHRGLLYFWRKGMSTLRGAGEFLDVNLQVGSKLQNYKIMWLTPYWKNSSWSLGVDLNYSRSKVISDDYNMNTFGVGVYGSHPFSSIWSYGWKCRLQNTIVNIDPAAGAQAALQHGNSGIVTGGALFLKLDSTDNSFKPHRGVRSNIECALDAVVRHANDPKVFPMAQFVWSNAAYYPVWRRGTLKWRGDARFLFPFGAGKPDMVPLSQRYFLGGENSVRGYKPAILGPKFPNPAPGTDPQPTGGMSSLLFSLEYVQNIFKPVDLFVFVDSGMISPQIFNAGSFKWSVGYGARLDIGNRLPFTLGMGYPLNPSSDDEVERFFFTMGGQF